MRTSRSLKSLSNLQVIAETRTLIARRCENTAELLEHLAEIDERQLYLPAAYPSMYAYCVGELKLSEESAAKKLQAVRAVQKVPALLDAIAEGRLHLSGLLLLAPHMTAENAGELVAAATHKTCAEIRLLLAERAPKPDVPTILQPVTASVSADQQDLNPVDLTIRQHGPDAVAPAVPRARLAPLSPGSFALQLTIATSTQEKLRYLQSLLGHVVPNGDLALVLDRALDDAIAAAEKQRFAPSSRCRAKGRNAKGRHIPMQVRREVWQRDGGQCTFVSESGHRCASRTRLELDHVTPVACGGQSTAGQLRLRCRAHNQYEADRAFGRGFMDAKRAAAKARQDEARARREVQAAAAGPARAAVRAATPSSDPDHDVTPWLRSLGFSVAEARAAAERCEAEMPDAPIEEKMRFALKGMAPRGRRPAA